MAPRIPTYDGSNDLSLEFMPPTTTCFSSDYFFLDETRKRKRFKEATINDSITRNSSLIRRCIDTGAGGGVGGGGGGGCNTNNLIYLPRLHFRDYILAYNKRYLEVEATTDAGNHGRGHGYGQEDEEEKTLDGTKLVQLLISCAEAVACRDRLHASTLLTKLRANALAYGTPIQRVGSCFVRGLSDRLAQIQPLGVVGFVNQMIPETVDVVLEKEEALRLAYQLCPHIQYGHFVANASILEAFEGESFVHVIDLGMTLGLPQGSQWCELMNSLMIRAGPPIFQLRVTGVGTSSEQLEAIGNQLEIHANSLGLNFEFLAVKSSLENLQPKHFNLVEGEVLAVNSMLQLHSAVKESRGALNSVLQVIHKLSPRVLALVEQDSGHNGPFFLGRFMEALHYYAAIFDSLDAFLPRNDVPRAKIEQCYFGEEIKNIVSCEGAARVERHESIDQWRRRMSRAKFQSAPMKMMTQAKQWLLQVQPCEGYTILEEKGCLVLGWKSRPIIAASCWKCN